MDTKKLRQKILDLAIHGKLVPQDPNDEPASVLLERIKAEKERLVKEGKIKKSKKSAKTSDTPHYENVLPKGWRLSTLGEVFTLQAGKNITAKDIKDAVTESHPYKCYGGNGVRGFVALYNREGDFPIIGRQGALCGNINIAKGKFYATEHAVVVESYCDVDLMWAYYILTTLNLNQYATATAQPGLSVAVINDVCIPIPPRKEQERISKEIEHWFDLIDQIEQGKSDLQTIIKQTKSKILDLAIHGKLVPQDPNDEPAIELLKRINPDFTPCDNGHSRKFPQSWCSVTVNDVCSIIGGVSYNKADIQDTGIRVLRGGNIQNGKVIDCFDDVFIPLSYQNNDNQVQHGDIIVVASTGSQTLIGKTGFADRDIPKTQIGAFLRIVRLKQKALSPYIRLIFQTDDYKGYIRNVAKGSNINNVKNAHLQNYQIYLPPLEEQQRIVQKIEELFSVLDNIQKALEV
ncbi:MAG: restriction endonuclease subunit S [Candidatus Cryptobacteroides sp.]|nr:restriction endonuclease subunit S [Candidatus Cryptobacteroides sp.]